MAGEPIYPGMLDSTGVLHPIQVLPYRCIRRQRAVVPKPRRKFLLAHDWQGKSRVVKQNISSELPIVLIRTMIRLADTRQSQVDRPHQAPNVPRESVNGLPFVHFAEQIPSDIEQSFHELRIVLVDEENESEREASVVACSFSFCNGFSIPDVFIHCRYRSLRSADGVVELSDVEVDV